MLSDAQTHSSSAQALKVITMILRCILLRKCCAFGPALRCCGAITCSTGDHHHIDSIASMRQTIIRCLHKAESVSVTSIRVTPLTADLISNQ